LKTTISLPLAIWGEGYGEFLPRWLEAVHRLNRLPDEIVLITDWKNRHLKELVDTDIPFKSGYLHVEDYRLWDYACRQATSRWLAFCNADDEFLPGALDSIDQAEAEGYNLILDSLIVRQTGHIWRSEWDANIMPHRFTMVGAEPMTKDLYEQAGGFNPEFQFPDWAMAVHMVHKSLARPFRSNTQRALFDSGRDRITMSGEQQNPNIKTAGTAQVHELARSLGLL
jgi:hypothetical protein